MESRAQLSNWIQTYDRVRLTIKKDKNNKKMDNSIRQMQFGDS